MKVRGLLQIYAANDQGEVASIVPFIIRFLAQLNNAAHTYIL